MQSEEEFAVPDDSESFHHRLQVQAEEQAQDLVWLLEQRMWLGKTMSGRPSVTWWRRLYQWLARHLAPRLNLQCQAPHWSMDLLVLPPAPTEDAIEVIEVEYQVQGVAIKPPSVKSLGKEGLP